MERTPKPGARMSDLRGVVRVRCGATGLLGAEDREVASRFKKRLFESGVPVVELRVYGSRARGDFSPESDLDVFLSVGELAYEIRETISELACECGFDADKVITTVEFTPDKVAKNTLRGDPFIHAVMEEGGVV